MSQVAKLQMALRSAFEVQTKVEQQLRLLGELQISVAYRLAEALHGTQCIIDRDKAVCELLRDARTGPVMSAKLASSPSGVQLHKDEDGKTEGS